MSNVKEINGRLSGQPYVQGYAPSKEDAALFTELFGNNNAVVQWAAQLASYYQSERADILKGTAAAAAPAAAAAAKAAPKPAAKAAPAKAAAADDDVDLFGEETEEDKAALAKKKADDAAAKDKKKKEAPIAKSSILMDVKPWDDETDLEDLAAKIKSNVRDGLVWGAHKIVPVAYTAKKLQILFVIEDDKVSSDDIEDIIVNQYEDVVQSMDIVAWNKI
jgi:elongation factor 1-beta